VARPPVVTVDGARQLRATLKRAGEDLADLRSTNAAVATYVAVRSAAAAPRRSGALAASVRGNAAATNATIRAGGAAVPYAGPIHWGWPARHIAAQPFIADTAATTEPAWAAIYRARVSAIVNRIRGL
jgi:hypothetical protein